MVWGVDLRYDGGDGAMPGRVVCVVSIVGGCGGGCGGISGCGDEISELGDCRGGWLTVDAGGGSRGRTGVR